MVDAFFVKTLSTCTYVHGQGDFVKWIVPWQARVLHYAKCTHDHCVKYLTLGVGGI